MLPDQTPNPEMIFTVRWRLELEEVFQTAMRLTERPFTHNQKRLAAAILILSRQGEEDFTAHKAVDFVHSNFAPHYRPHLAVADTPEQRRWLNFDWGKWYGYVPLCVEALNSDSPMNVFNVHLAE